MIAINPAVINAIGPRNSQNIVVSVSNASPTIPVADISIFPALLFDENTLFKNLTSFPSFNLSPILKNEFNACVPLFIFVTVVMIPSKPNTAIDNGGNSSDASFRYTENPCSVSVASVNLPDQSPNLSLTFELS